MKDEIINALVRLNLYAPFKLIKEKFFRNPVEIEREKKRFNFYSGIVKKGDLCFDVGASYGSRTETFLKLGAKVVAVEPQTDPANYLRMKFKKKILLERKALGSKPGLSEMFVSSHSVLSSLSEEWIGKVKPRFSNAKWEKRIRVEITTLDEMIKKYGMPDFCKIDVEGYEMEVLRGLTRPIKLLSFEFTVPEFTGRALECISWMENLDSYLCNYSPGESMEFGLEEWIGPGEFKILFKNLSTGKIADGDIYLKLKS